MPSPDRFASRRENLLRLMREKQIPALLVTNVQNVTYLTGFSGDASPLLVSPQQLMIFSDTRFTTQLRQECPEIPVEIRTSRTSTQALIAETIPKFGITQLAFESHVLTVNERDELADALKTITLVPHSNVVETLRIVKDAGEIAATRAAVLMAERGFHMLRAELLPEMTEQQASFDLEHFMRRFGAHKAAFEPIIAAGDRAALPHAHATEKRLSESPFVLIDWGAATHDGYRSDLTRVIPTGAGPVPAKLREIYEVVLKAQLTAIAAIRPGASCQEIDSLARTVIDQSGYGPYFGHGLGHGIGLVIHESPRFSPVSKETLQPGMIVTVEPGIYLPDQMGVRLEDDILVTEEGHEVLSSVPKIWEEVFG